MQEGHKESEPAQKPETQHKNKEECSGVIHMEVPACEECEAQAQMTAFRGKLECCKCDTAITKGWWRQPCRFLLCEACKLESSGCRYPAICYGGRRVIVVLLVVVT